MSDVPYTRLARPTLWLVRGDDFTMGGDGPDEGPRFEAEVRSFYLSKNPVTNEEYEVYDPAHERGPTSPHDDSPVVGVSFRDAVGYCRWYSERSGKPFRLPTEVEWEFACRGGQDSRYPWGDDPAGADAHAWDADNSEGACHRVEQRRANSFGVYDMIGNVWEWTGSLFAPYPVTSDDADEPDDPDAPGPRTTRGGSFRTPRGAAGAATRQGLDPDTRRDDLGFRILRLL